MLELGPLMGALSNVSADVLAFEKELTGRNSGFSDEVKKLEDKAQKDAMHERPNPLSEEGLRNIDKDQHEQFHSYIELKRMDFCQFCDADGKKYIPKWMSTNEVYLRGPSMTPEKNWRDVDVNHTKYTGLSGADRTAMVFPWMSDLRRRGFTNNELIGALLHIGFSQGARQYVADLDFYEAYMRKKVVDDDFVGFQAKLAIMKSIPPPRGSNGHSEKTKENE